MSKPVITIADLIELLQKLPEGWVVTNCIGSVGEPEALILGEGYTELVIDRTLLVQLERRGTVHRVHKKMTP